MAKIGILVTLGAVMGRRAALLEEFKAHAARSLENEPGCLRFDVLVPADAADRLHAYEMYEDAAAFEAHRESDHMALWRERSADLIQLREVTPCTVVETNG